ncbi:hypothetical protein BZG36_01261 [Bifiguratus adelaidae]|uniref:DNA mismatch repair protein S5 domain-containing protein n=1 Tax=Bifiguratus adelaidae TaxID=1938954 RepID=A0A261Y5T2_9FUNG|nr:hypothetical protein BZG36_01261 [Bifiguratus adelaidae]
MQTPRPIQRLEQSVVNRIAAGEIIQRPANAVKELIENSLDAGSTSIQVLVKEGGLKLLQIQDNGCGIRREDLAIVCERFTTSKLQKFDDLAHISTYGFRGEALASITHVAHVTITTKTASEPCAYRASYSDGKLVPARPGQSAEPKPAAGNNGTQITAEDLFYNVPSRRKALKNASEEYNRILDIVSRYAVHNAGIAFTCKKHGSTSSDLNTSSAASTIDLIRTVYGSSVATELVHVKERVEKLDLDIEAYVTNGNYHVKKMSMLLFINHRAVESQNIKRNIEQVYSTILPRNTHPFVYISLNLKPEHVDVNVHPTKREVHFLNEDSVISSLCDAIQEAISSMDNSRSFLSQRLLPGAGDPSEGEQNRVGRQNNAVKIAENKMVRTDSRMRTLDSFVEASRSVASKDQSTEDIAMQSVDTVGEDEPTAQAEDAYMEKSPVSGRSRVEVRLTSVLSLRKEVLRNEHAPLTDLLKNHTFVGCIDNTFALIQHQTRLLMVNFTTLSEELFYQLILLEFCNFGTLVCDPPVSISDLLSIALDTQFGDTWPENMRSKEDIIDAITTALSEKREMLLEYFSMEISEDGILKTLPLLLKSYTPNMAKLPLFMLRLGAEEKGCFQTLSRELAIFYSAEFCQGNANSAEDAPDEEQSAYRWQVEHILFPAFKHHLRAQKSLIEEGRACIVQLANLPDLYRVFERC